MDGRSVARLAARVLGVGAATYGAFLVVVVSALQSMDAGPRVPAWISTGERLVQVELSALQLLEHLLQRLQLVRERGFRAGLRHDRSSFLVRFTVASIAPSRSTTSTSSSGAMSPTPRSTRPSDARRATA